MLWDLGDDAAALVADDADGGRRDAQRGRDVLAQRCVQRRRVGAAAIRRAQLTRAMSERDRGA